MKNTVKPFVKDSILEALPDAIIWVYPVFNTDGSIKDFQIGYANPLAEKVLPDMAGNLVGLQILKDHIPSSDSTAAWVTTFSKIYQSGAPKEFSFFLPTSNRRFKAYCKPHEGGILSIIREQEEPNEREKAQLLNGIIASTPVGMLVYEAVRNEAGELVDFRLKLSSDSMRSIAKITWEEGHKLSFKELLHQYGAGSYYNRYLETMQTGHPFSFEYYYPRTHKWFCISVVKLGDGFLLTLSNITEVKKSEQHLQNQSRYLNSILNASLNGIYVLDAVKDAKGKVQDFVFAQCNERFAELTGWSIDQIVGNSFLTLFPHTKESGLYPLFNEIIENSQPQNQLMYYAKAFNKWYNYKAVKMGENSVVVTFEDVTLQREAMLQIEQQKELLNQILEHSPAGITVTEVLRNEDGAIFDGRTILANKAAATFTGIPNELTTYKTLRQIDPAIMESPLYQMAIATLHSGQPFHTQYYFTPTERWLEVSVAKMDENHLINVFIDVTPTKEAQLKQEKLIEELKRTNANLEQFAYAASHDLKEPVRKIQLFSDRLQRQLANRLTEEEADWFERMNNASYRMQLLIDDLLNYSYVGQVNAFLEAVDLNKKIQVVLQDLEVLIEEMGAKITVDPLPTIKGHRRQLQQLFQNLISNALKYGKPNVTPAIHITSRLVKGKDTGLKLTSEEGSENYYLIEVQDNGIGFNQQDAERIFNVFIRLNEKGVGTGTGLGLAIARKVMENHNGYIWAESEIGKGTTFKILFPVQSVL